MVNSESHSSNDQVPPSTTCSPHEDGFEEAENKLMECALTLPKVQEFVAKVDIEAFKAATSHDEEDKFADYMKGGACKESFMALAECSDRDKQIAVVLECMEADSDYHHKYLKIIEEQWSNEAMKELESILPGGEGNLFLGVHEFFTKGEGGCCKEQYMATMDCHLETTEEGQSDPSFTTFYQKLLRLL